jgi:hypothetical protein
MHSMTLAPRETRAEFFGFGKSGRRGPYLYSVLLYRYPEKSFGYFASVVNTSEDGGDSSQFWGQMKFATVEEAQRNGVVAVRKLLEARRTA